MCHDHACVIVLSVPSAVRTLIFYNPASGRGQGEKAANELRHRLDQLAHPTTLLKLQKSDAPTLKATLASALAGVDLLIVIGGDGTLHATLPAAMDSSAAVYHLAFGTENLFAREFGMTRDLDRLVAAITASRTRAIDLATLTLDDLPPHPFSLMCSIGPDAGVIRRLDAVRRGPITHASYLRPIAAELFSPSLPSLTIDADGERIVTDQPGMAVVANSRQYAMRIDPALNASMTDGLLDLVFFPARNPVSMAWWILKSRLRLHLGKPLVYRAAKALRITAPVHPGVAPAYQLDGECGRHTFPKGVNMVFQVHPGALKVLLP